jgi:signal transduction histidine kinase
MDRESQFIITFAFVKIHFIIGLILLLVSKGSFADAPRDPIPVNGVLDLRETVMDRNSFHNLNGEWEFYWEQLLTPDHFVQVKSEGKGIIVTVPSYWKDYEIEGNELPGFGYGTYALTILLPPGTRSGICMDIPVFDVAHKFFLNERLVSENGTVGTSRETEKPWYEPGRFCYIPDSDTLQLLIQVSNYHHRRGGFWQSVMMGGSSAILDRAERRSMYNYSTIGVLFFFTIFFFIFWLFNRSYTITIVFALTTLGILIRSVNTGLYFSNSFIDTPWAWQIRMEYFGSYLATLFGMLFLHRIFPLKYMKHIITGNMLILSLLIISEFIFPPRLFTYGMLIFQPLLLIFLLHYLVVSFIGTLRGRGMDAIFFVSLGLFIYTLINDIMLANSAGSLSNNYLSQISFQVFILAMSVMIIMQWVNNYKTRLRLESSLIFKNKVLSAIAHDLKNPVASIAQFVDLMVSKPELTLRKQILESLQESSQAAVTLLDNLLYWGRSQADELKVSPDELDLAEVVADVESLFSHMAVQKRIELTSDVHPGTLAYADKALVNIIIRNLVSNALKFTPAGGKVDIRVWPEGEKVFVSVTDTGIGINPETLEKFNDERQLATTIGTDKEIGTGLGLQLVSDLVKRNHGILKVDSTPGKGSSFTFTLQRGKQKKNNENQ